MIHLKLQAQLIERLKLKLPSSNASIKTTNIITLSEEEKKMVKKCSLAVTGAKSTPFIGSKCMHIGP